MSIINKSISDFLDKEYKEFAMYVNESRSIPSIIDGLKPTQRKIVHTSNLTWRTGTEKILKIFQLGGKIAAECYYHHGDASLYSTIINMAQKFKNNLPLLEEDGQFGSLRAPEAGAARYIGTKLSSNFRLVYKDFDLLDYKEEEGDKIEPKYFLPIIPTVLVNNTSGVAVGFATNILNRCPKELTKVCISYLKTDKVNTISPKLNCFDGTYIRDEQNDKRWIIRGVFEKVNTSTIKITELPPKMTYEKYEAILEKLIDDKKIVSYDDKSKDKIEYVIKFTRNDLAVLTDEQIIKLLKLEEYETENFMTLDEHGKLLKSESFESIVKYFVDFRLTYYDKRKEFSLEKMRRELKILANKGKFIHAILEQKISINNKSKQFIIDQIESMNLDKIDDSYDYLLRMPIYSLTKELYEKLKNDFILKKQEIKNLEETDPKNMYLDDLSVLYKNL